MSARTEAPRSCRLFLLLLLLTFLGAVLLPPTARGQGLEVHGGWAQVTGDFGTDGFNVGAAWWFTKHVTIAGDYESTWDTSSLSNFAFTQVGAIAVKSHLQSALFGPRIFFSTDWTNEHKLNPFGEAQFGVSHLYQKITQVNLPNVLRPTVHFPGCSAAGPNICSAPIGRAERTWTF